MIVPDTKWHPDLSGAGRSKYKALAEAIRSGIISGQLPAGQKLPPVRELAFQIGVTPGTVARAYGVMTDEGRLVAEVGRGTYVAGRVMREPARDVPLINTVNEEIADFRSSRVPDVGQGRFIDDAMIRVAQSHRRRHINYPTEETDQEVREALVDWIAPGHLGPLSADDIVLANGAQNASILALQAILSGPTPVILTEDLAYPGGRHAARLLRAKVVGVEMDEHGLIPEALEQAYREHGGQVLLTSAEVHSPTTIKTPLERKLALANLADSLNLVIVEDDCHATVPTDVPSYRAIQPTLAYYISSLTKSVSGALRFGYAVAPAGQSEVLRQTAQSSFYGVSQPLSDICCDLLTSGEAGRIRDRVAKATAARVRLAVNILGGWDIKWREDAPFIWISMPQGWRASRLMAACERRGILIKPADEFALPEGKAPNAVRLAVNTCNSDDCFVAALEAINTLLGNPNAKIDG